jgi:hypothetical protein
LPSVATVPTPGTTPPHRCYAPTYVPRE